MYIEDIRRRRKRREKEQEKMDEVIDIELLAKEVNVFDVMRISREE